jgi:hypothetical protein
MGEQAAREARQRAALDVARLRVRSGVPLPPKSDMAGQLLALLLSMEKDQSVEVPAAVRGTLLRAVTRANKVQARKYEVRKLGDVVGVWRTA